MMKTKSLKQIFAGALIGVSMIFSPHPAEAYNCDDSPKNKELSPWGSSFQNTQKHSDKDYLALYRSLETLIIAKDTKPEDIVSLLDDKKFGEFDADDAPYLHRARKEYKESLGKEFNDLTISDADDIMHIMNDMERRGEAADGFPYGLFILCAPILLGSAVFLPWGNDDPDDWSYVCTP